jgi:hypothetical protein
MEKLTEGSSRPSAAMTSAGSTNRGITNELQVLSYGDPVLEYDQTGFDFDFDEQE